MLGSRRSQLLAGIPFHSRAATWQGGILYPRVSSTALAWRDHLEVLGDCWRCYVQSCHLQIIRQLIQAHQVGRLYKIGTLQVPARNPAALPR